MGGGRMTWGCFSEELTIVEPGPRPLDSGLRRHDGVVGLPSIFRGTTFSTVFCHRTLGDPRGETGGAPTVPRAKVNTWKRISGWREK